MKALLSTCALAALCGLFVSSRQPGATRPASEAVEYEIDPTHSFVIFRSKHLGVSQAYGRFDDFSGKVEYDAAKPANSAVMVVINAGSVDTNSRQRDDHLRSPDFFSAKEYPEIIFESTSVSGTPEKLEVKGELTLHGVTKEVSAEADLVGMADTRMGARAGFEAHFTIDMRDFGIEFVEKNPGAVGPTVDVTVSLECQKK